MKKVILTSLTIVAVVALSGCAEKKSCCAPAPVVAPAPAPVAAPAPAPEPVVVEAPAPVIVEEAAPVIIDDKTSAVQ